jgi:tRNA threonylcarbamoyladenosine biosynthesis protein TsaB
VALLEGARALAEAALPRGREHAASVLVAVDRVLRRGGVGLDAVERIALSIGPGSFTGLRVGLATALGLCFGTQRRIVPVPTLAALSLQAAGHERIAPLLDARRGQIYAGLYGPDAVALRGDAVADPLPWLESLRGLGRVAFLGSGARAYAREIARVLGAGASLLPAEAGVPRAASVGALAERIAARGGALPPGEVELRYLRAPEAEAARAR